MGKGSVPRGDDGMEVPVVDEESIQRLIRLHPLLRIARWHLDQIDTTETTTPELASLVVDHAVVATVFSAAAVERRLSDFLCSPILFMEEEGPRRFLGRLITRYVLRLPARQKLQFLRDQAPEIKGKPILVKIEDLFERRNRIVHTSYTYREVLMLHDQVYDPKFHGDVPETSLTARGSLHSEGPNAEAVEQAKSDYETAGEFIRTMWSVKPYQPWPPAWLERAARERGMSLQLVIDSSGAAPSVKLLCRGNPFSGPLSRLFQSRTPRTRAMAENMLRKLAKTWPDSNTGSNALDKIYLEAKRV